MIGRAYGHVTGTVASAVELVIPCLQIAVSG